MTRNLIVYSYDNSSFLHINENLQAKFLNLSLTPKKSKLSNELETKGQWNMCEATNSWKTILAIIFYHRLVCVTHGAALTFVRSYIISYACGKCSIFEWNILDSLYPCKFTTIALRTYSYNLDIMLYIDVKISNPVHYLLSIRVLFTMAIVLKVDKIKSVSHI